MNVVGDGKVNWYCCPESWVTDIKLNNDYAAILCHWLSVKWQFYQGLDATGNVSVLMKGFILETDDSMEVWGAGAVVGWCLLLLSLMLYDCLQSIHCCFMFFLPMAAMTVQDWQWYRNLFKDVARGCLDSNWSFGELPMSQCQSVSVCQCQNCFSLSVSVSLHALLCQSALHWDRLIHRFWPSSSSTSAPLLVLPCPTGSALACGHRSLTRWRFRITFLAWTMPCSSWNTIMLDPTDMMSGWSSTRSMRQASSDGPSNLALFGWLSLDVLIAQTLTGLNDTLASSSSLTCPHFTSHCH